jgi:excisionase family DNA binding protein
MTKPEQTIDYRPPEWVAEQLGIERNTVYKYLQEGTLPGLQIGRKWLVSERRLAEFLDATASRQTEERKQRAAVWSKRLRNIDKFTERARRSLEIAREQAVEMNHNYLGTEHILLGAAQEPEGLAAIVLRNLGVSAGELRPAVESAIGRGEHPVSGDFGMTPRANDALKQAFDEARALGHKLVGTEHLLLGTLAVGAGVAHSILTARGVTLESARDAVTRRLAKTDPRAD